MWYGSAHSEDIDRLQAVLAPDASGAATQTRTAATAFRQSVSATFLEVVSSLDPDRLVQQTEVFRTTVSLVRQPEGAMIHFRIAEVQRDGPLVEVTTPGLLVADLLSPLTLRATSGQFDLASAELTDPEGNRVVSLDVADQQASGTFSAQSGPQHAAGGHPA